MRKLGTIVALVALSACAPRNQAQAPTTAQWDAAAVEELKAASVASLKAWETGDTAAIAAEITSDGYLTSYDLDMMGQPISFNSSAEVVAHAQKMTEAMKAMGATMTSKLTRVDCQATSTFGVCINEMECEVNMGGKIETLHFRGTGTARKGDDGWKWTHWHGSMAKMPAMPAAPAAAPAPEVKAPLDAVAMKKKDLKWETAPGPLAIKVATTWTDPKTGASTAYVEMPRGMKAGRHYHTANSWIHVIKGSMKVTFVDGKVVELQEGDFGFAPAMMQHTTEAKNGVTLFQYTDGPESIVPVDDQGKPLPPPPPPAAPAPAAPAAKAPAAPAPAAAPAAAKAPVATSAPAVAPAKAPTPAAPAQ